MRTLDEYMKLPYKMEIVQDPDEGGYVVSFPDLPGCLTSGETIESAVENAEDAKREWLKTAIEDNYPIAEPDSLDQYQHTWQTIPNIWGIVSKNGGWVFFETDASGCIWDLEPYLTEDSACRHAQQQLRAEYYH